MRTSHHPGRPLRLVRGVSIVELMVGVTIGLFILAGATLVASTQLADNRRLLMHMQVQQDLRATVDIIGRDLRRAGYWANGYQHVWPTSAATGTANPYAGLAITPTSVTYSRSNDERRTSVVAYDNGLLDNDEQVGFRLNQNNKTVEMMVSPGNWQALTDPNVIEVTQFDVTATRQGIPAPCGEQCPALGPGGCPLELQVRDISIVISARATNEPAVVRSVQSDLRLRNDLLVERCP
jgi:prepilin peptidase dependent protein B